MSENAGYVALLSALIGYAAVAFVTIGMWLSVGPISILLGVLWPATWLTYLGWWLAN